MYVIGDTTFIYKKVNVYLTVLLCLSYVSCAYRARGMFSPDETVEDEADSKNHCGI